MNEVALFLNEKGEVITKSLTIAAYEFNDAAAYTYSNVDTMVVDRLLSLPGLIDTTVSQQVLMLTENGEVVVASLSRIIEDLDITKDDPVSCDEELGVYNPSWQSAAKSDHGALYTDPACPTRVGIGLDNPAYSFDVLRESRFSGNVGIGIDPAQTSGAKLSVKKSGAGVGLEVSNFSAIEPIANFKSARYNQTMVSIGPKDAFHLPKGRGGTSDSCSGY